MAIDFSDPAVIMSGGKPIPVDTEAEYQAALQAATQIYSARPGGAFGSEELNDLENRIRGGQTIDEITRNTYDDALRRFPATTAADLASRDAQLNAGRQYTPTAQQIESIYSEAGISAATAQAAAIPSRQLAAAISPERQLATQTFRPMMNAGPAGTFGTRTSTGGGLNIGMLLMIGGAGLLVFLLLRKKGR